MAKLIKDTYFCVLDTETTGINKQRDKLVEISLIVFKPFEYKYHKVLDALINPGIPIPATASKIHGITDAMVKQEKDIKDLFPDVIKLISDYPLIAHNAAFDMTFLNVISDYLKIPFENDNMVFDSLILARETWKDTRHNLDDLAVFLGLDWNGKHHRSIIDCQMTIKIFERALKEKNINEFSELVDICKAKPISKYKVKL